MSRNKLALSWELQLYQEVLAGRTPPETETTRLAALSREHGVTEIKKKKLEGRKISLPQDQQFTRSLFEFPKGHLPFFFEAMVCVLFCL